MGQLRSVIPPKATELLNTPGNNWSLSATPQINTDLCYGYFYDSRGRCIMKRIPGKGKSYTAYDLYNRVVMTQDPRLAAAGQWAFVLYDAQSRPWRSGVITTATLKDSVIAQASRSMAYPTLTGTYTITSETYFDNYDWVSGSGSGLSASLQTTNINGTNFITSYNTSPDYAQQIVAGSRTRGSITGTKKIILNTANYLYSLSLYDNQGRNIQSKQTNYSGGTDVATVQYSYAGRTLRSHLAHQKSGTNAQTHTLLTKYTYDHIGRIKTLTKNFDGLGDKAISQNTYSETGGVDNHVIGGGIETQVYTYNIRGWITGINGNHVTNTNPSAFFGETIAYDYGFTNSQLTGNKAGIKWRAAGDSNVRAYGYSYDNVNRLILAGYSQQNTVGSGSWTKDKMDFTASNMTYDANGNILSMSQRGLQVGSISLIDSLRYSYFANSNQLQKVADLSTGGGFMGDFKDSSSTGDDYTYDVNGNINRDNNRRMHGASNAPGAVFNILDKADSIVIADKATTYYYYDAGGAMLAKKVNTYRPTGTTVKNYQYLGGFVYLNDTLQYTLIEGGRIRYAKKRNSATGDTFYAYEYDYFISDHMGNVRSVVTEGRDTAIYQATMETARQAVEDATFANVYTPTNTITNKSDVPDFDNNRSNQKVSVLNGNNNKVGAAIVLKVMAGDNIQLSTYAYYNTIQPPVSGVNLLSELLNVLAGGVVNNSPGKLNSGNTSAVSTALSPNVTNFLNNDRSYDNTKPKAYLNWIFFDNQFNFISGSSDAMQVDMAGSTGKKAMVPSLQTMPKNGYLYVYISNESNQNVYFDDITVRHTTGPLMQEQAYYPYGLEIQGLSDKALMKAATNYKYNAGSELEDEDGIGYYNTFYRKYDAQIGRFSGVDVLAEKMTNLTPFHFGANNPASFNDPLGDQFTQNGYNPNSGRSIKGPDNSFHTPWLAEMKWNDAGFYDWGNQGNASGNYTNMYGVSSQAIMNNMMLGNKMGLNKNKGEYGYWAPYTFDSPIVGDGGVNLDGVGVGTKWVSFSDVFWFKGYNNTGSNSESSSGVGFFSFLIGAVEGNYSMWEATYDHSNYYTTKGILKPILKANGQYRSERAKMFGIYSHSVKGTGLGLSILANIVTGAQVYNQYKEGGLKNVNVVDATSVSLGTAGIVANGLSWAGYGGGTISAVSKFTGVGGVAIQIYQGWSLYYGMLNDLTKLQPTTGSFQSDFQMQINYDNGQHNELDSWR